MSFEHSSLSSFPRPQTSLVGRSAETAAIHALLVEPNVRMVTLTGPGGAGKTRLALHAALTIEGFAGGRWFVELAGISDPALVLPRIAQTLGIRERGADSVRDQVVTVLDGRETLLVLDNFEHLLEGATVVSQLLSTAGGLKIVITSRSPLNLVNEHIVPVGPLGIGVPSGTAPHNEAVELFLQRSRAIRPGYDPAPADLQAIAAICTELSGSPLAIELAAARIRVMAPQALHTRLSQPLRLLASGPHDAPERHRSMRDAIDWSYQLLPDNQRAMLREMGVFAGSIPLDGIEAVAAEAGIASKDETIEVIGRLIDASMVEVVETEIGEPRFLVYATVREFVVDELQRTGELPAARDRHAAWIELLTTRLEPDFDGPREHIALERVGLDLDNVRAALGWALERPDLGRAARIVGNLWSYWSFGGQSSEGLRWIDRLMPRLEEARLSMEDERRLQLAAGLVFWSHGDAVLASVRYERALALALQLGDPIRQADALMWLSQAAWYAGDYEAMRGFAQDALEFEATALVAAACAHTLLGIAEMRLGRLDVAECELRTARDQHGQISFTRGSIWTLQLLADLALLRGDRVGSARSHRESLALGLESSNMWGIFEDLSGLLTSATQLGWTEEALDLLASAELLLTSSAVLPREGAWLSAADRAHLKVGLAPDDLQRLAQIAASRTLPQVVERASQIALAIESGAQPRMVPSKPARKSPEKNPFELSAREREVLALLVQGQTDRQIADSLSVSHGTARTHVAHILQKLHARNRAVAVRKALELDLVSAQ